MGAKRISTAKKAIIKRKFQGGKFFEVEMSDPKQSIRIFPANCKRVPTEPATPTNIDNNTNNNTNTNTNTNPNTNTNIETPSAAATQATKVAKYAADNPRVPAPPASGSGGGGVGVRANTSSGSLRASEGGDDGGGSARDDVSDGEGDDGDGSGDEDISLSDDD